MSCSCGDLGCNCLPSILVNEGPSGDNGNNGWTPLFAVVTDSARRVLQVSDWIGGTGTKPVTGLYAGSSGLTSDISTATDIRGAAGATGATGADGEDGWSPLLAVVADGERRVLQIYDWYGGTGSEPATGDYLGPLGPTSVIGDAEDIRGAQGAAADTTTIPQIGSSMEWYTNSDPNANWMIQDGRAISRTTYATLFALLGITFGAGNGTTTFNIPNRQGRVPVGRDAGQTEFDTIGETGGAKTHTLSISEMPSHRHTASSIVAGLFGLIRRSIVGESNTVASVDSTGSGTEPDILTTPAAIPLEGGGQAHNNLQPYIVVNFIIRVL